MLPGPGRFHLPNNNWMKCRSDPENEWLRTAAGLVLRLRGAVAKLCQADLLRLEALRPTLHDKRNSCALVERSISARFNSRKMDEDVFPILALDKSKSLGSVKPLHRTGFFHVSLFLLSMRSNPTRIETRTVRRRSWTNFEVPSSGFNDVQDFRIL